MQIHQPAASISAFESNISLISNLVLRM